MQDTTRDALTATAAMLRRTAGGLERYVYYWTGAPGKAKTGETDAFDKDDVLRHTVAASTLRASADIVAATKIDLVLAKGYPASPIEGGGCPEKAEGYGAGGMLHSLATMYLANVEYWEDFMVSETITGDGPLGGWFATMASARMYAHTLRAAIAILAVCGIPKYDGDSPLHAQNRVWSERLFPTE